jgi:voltage-gated sodium channel
MDSVSSVRVNVPPAEPQSNCFSEINNLRRGSAGEEVDLDAIERAKYNDAFFGKLASSKPFEYTTLSIIMLNACFIGYDADFSARRKKPENLYDCSEVEPDACYQFIVFENLFAVYFTAEVIIRFFAYKHKQDCIRDAWFVFDSSLVAVMVVETWVLPVVTNGSSGLSQFSVLRLLRLLRITRMAKLMRFFPELQIIMKGMVAAFRSVVCTAILFSLILYVFAILFTSTYHQGDNDDDSYEEWQAEMYFGSLGKSMRYLFIMGTILDDITLCCNAIRSSNNWLMLAAFIAFVLISSFTMLNMLIGILCEVVVATGEGERNKNTEVKVKEAIEEIFTRIDKDGNGQITRKEFVEMRHNKSVKIALKALEVTPRHFDMYTELMFKRNEDASELTTIGYKDMINMIMRLRPGTTVSALDFASFQSAVRSNHLCLHNHIKNIRKMVTAIAGDETAASRSPSKRRPSKSRPAPTSEPPEKLDKIEITPLPQLEKMDDLELLAELQHRLATAPASCNGASPAPSSAQASPGALMQLPGNPDTLWAEDEYTHYRC